MALEQVVAGIGGAVRRRDARPSRDLGVLAGDDQRVEIGVTPGAQRGRARRSAARQGARSGAACRGDGGRPSSAVLRLRARSARARSSVPASRAGSCWAQPAVGLGAAAERAQPALAVLGGEVLERVPAPRVLPAPGEVRARARWSSSACASCSMPVRGRDRGHRADLGVGGAEREQRRPQVGHRPGGGGAEVGLGQDEHVGHLHDACLQELEHVARGRLERRPRPCPRRRRRRSRTGRPRRSRSRPRRTRPRALRMRRGWRGRGRRGACRRRSSG